MGTEIDGIVATAVFLLFVAWAFTYYSGIDVAGQGLMGNVLEAANTKIMGFLKPESYKVSLKYDSNANTSGSVVYFDYAWEFGKETTVVYKNNVQLLCRLDGNRVYFMADLVQGSNYFSMAYTNEAGAGCGSDFSVSNNRQAEVLAKEKESMVSEKRMDELESADYESFKKQISMGSDFRVVMNRSGSMTVFGKDIPGNGNVYSKLTLSRIRESGENIEVRVFVW